MTYADVQSILVLGDSISKGVVLHPQKKRYVFSREGFIPRLIDRLRPKVFDCSKFGSTTAYGQSLLRNKLVECNPDLVLIEYGSNDSDYNWDEVAANPEGKHLPKLSLRRYVKNIREMVDAIRESGKIPLVTNLHPLDGEGYFNWFTKGESARKASVMKWLGHVERIYWWQEMYSHALERTAKTCGVDVVNIRGAFLRQKDYKQYMCEDGIHPNEDGQKLIEDAFLEAINRRAASLLK